MAEKEPAMWHYKAKAYLVTRNAHLKVTRPHGPSAGSAALA
jgi:hypothetical protein